MAPCVNNLLKLKADITTQDKDGNTVLHYTGAMDSIELCSLLLKAKADPTVANHNGQIPRDLISASNRDLVQLFDSVDGCVQRCGLLLMFAMSSASHHCCLCVYASLQR